MNLSIQTASLNAGEIWQYFIEFSKTQYGYFIVFMVALILQIIFIRTKVRFVMIQDKNRDYLKKISAQIRAADDYHSQQAVINENPEYKKILNMYHNFMTLRSIFYIVMGLSVISLFQRFSFSKLLLANCLFAMLVVFFVSRMYCRQYFYKKFSKVKEETE